LLTDNYSCSPISFMSPPPQKIDFRSTLAPVSRTDPPCVFRKLVHPELAPLVPSNELDRRLFPFCLPSQRQSQAIPKCLFPNDKGTFAPIPLFLIALLERWFVTLPCLMSGDPRTHWWFFFRCTTVVCLDLCLPLQSTEFLYPPPLTPPISFVVFYPYAPYTCSVFSHFPARLVRTSCTPEHAIGPAFPSQNLGTCMP